MKSQPKILHITSWYPSIKKPFLGNFVQDLFWAFHKFYPNSSFKIGFDPLTETPPPFCSTKIPAGFGKERIKTLWSRIKDIKQSKADVLHFHIADSQIVELLYFCLFSKCKVLLTEHGSYCHPKNFEKLPLLKRLALNFIFRKVDCLVVVSNDMQTYFSPKIQQKIQVIGNALPEVCFKHSIRQDSKSGIYQFIHVSTLVSVKNFDGILSALIDLKMNGYSDFRFRVISDESYEQYESKAKQFGLSELISFEGPCNKKEVLKAMEESDCFVLNSYSETFSIVNAEACCLGLYVITTPVGFLADVKAPGIAHVNKNDSQSLALEMKKAISKKLHGGINNRSLVEKFKETQVIQSYSNLYQSF